MSPQRNRAIILAAAGVATAVLAVSCLPRSHPGADPTADLAAGPPAAVVRVDQVGYAPGEAKHAYLMTSRPVTRAPFRVLDGSGKEVLSGTAGPSTGRWSSTYKSVHTLDLSRLTAPGDYRVEVTGSLHATSPKFRVAPADELLDKVVQDNVRFFAAQRDGADVDADVLRRKPSHLTDRQATLYDTPAYDEDAERLLEPLKPVGGPVDVSGGWFDAGDFLKFTHTASYSTASLLLAQRTTPAGGEKLAEEARHGLDWLDKMWDGSSGTLYVQVGIGVGDTDDGSGKVRSDHDVWRLPEADDAMRVRPGDPDYTIKHRPVFRAAPPGEPISPNLAGRVAAAFALAAQLDAEDDPERASTEMEKAAQIYALADTSPKGQLVTAFPHGFYPESSWEDDMEFGAAELALAGEALGDDRTQEWSRQAGHWAKQYLSSDNLGTLGLGDVSALAHADLAKLIDDGRPSGEVGRERLVADLKRQLEDGKARAARDPFRAGADYTDFDSVPHAFGLATTAQLYHRVTGDSRYDSFATQQRNWALGANAWGSSFVIGEGSTFPHCPEHQAANLAGSLTGKGDILVGGVVNGPNEAAKLRELNSFPTMRPCPTRASNPFSAFNGHGGGYMDNVGAWQTVEAADDFTATALLAFSLSTGPEDNEPSERFSS
ncbi:hydrolase [Streptomyces cellostaticus]|uniref:Hydrolase n=1 Tax=Streptomyces cellostaticus TaxID=67285 RepID=A0A124HBF5_9ACTN|nr:glycoside hydrolase family 9 protein [Streptomyces cellostaticus]KUM91103.1 hydrolase [Streptomyces cellostaticus]GHI01762.1 hydrolase [Streptomyces cellostaticus]